MRALITLVARTLSPVPERTLSGLAACVGRPVATFVNHRTVMRQMIADGALRRETIDGMPYIWPFDPVVWDRRRFEHLWGWAYRFEAYTPIAKRLRGYYAMPLLWGSSVIGWANIRATTRDLDVQLGYVEKKPRSRDFDRELAAEVERFRTFMRLAEETRIAAFSYTMGGAPRAKSRLHRRRLCGFGRAWPNN